MAIEGSHRTQKIREKHRAYRNIAKREAQTRVSLIMIYLKRLWKAKFNPVNLDESQDGSCGKNECEEIEYQLKEAIEKELQEGVHYDEDERKFIIRYAWKTILFKANPNDY